MVAHYRKSVICLYCGDILKDVYYSTPMEDRGDFAVLISASIIRYLDEKGVNCNRCSTLFQHPVGNDPLWDEVIYDFDSIFEPLFIDYDIFYEKVENVFFDGDVIYIVV